MIEAHTPGRFLSGVLHWQAACVVRESPDPVHLRTVGLLFVCLYEYRRFTRGDLRSAVRAESGDPRTICIQPFSIREIANDFIILTSLLSRSLYDMD